jgi:hypothetical protein
MSNKKKADVSVIVMVLVVIAVLVLGSFAVAPKIKETMAIRQSEQLSERVQNGTATVEDLANSEGMQFDEYLAKYEVKDVKKDTNMMDFMEKLTLKNYCTFAAVEYSDEALEEYKALAEAAEDAEKDDKEEKEEKAEITADTTDMEAKYGFAQYLYAKQQEEMNGPVEVDPEAETETEAEAE